MSAEVGRGRQLLRQRENLIRGAAGPHQGSGVSLKEEGL